MSTALDTKLGEWQAREAAHQQARDQEAAAAQAERNRANAAVRTERQAAQRAQQQAQAATTTQALETRLAPHKERLQRQWMADHPGHGADEFTRLAWPLLRENLLAEEAQALHAATLADLRRSGIYDL